MQYIYIHIYRGGERDRGRQKRERLWASRRVPVKQRSAHCTAKCHSAHLPTPLCLWQLVLRPRLKVFIMVYKPRQSLDGFSVPCSCTAINSRPRAHGVR